MICKTRIVALGAFAMSFQSCAIMAQSGRGQEAASPTDPSVDRQEVGGNPRIAGGLTSLGPDALGTRSNRREVYSYSGRRAGPWIGHSIAINDQANGPASTSGTSTADTASYGLAIFGVRPAWTTATLTGEMNGASLFIRQANGDSAALLGNVGIRRGFGAFAESYTFAADGQGNAIRAVNLQLGVVNARDGGEYGVIAQAAGGHDLTAAFRATSVTGSSWSDLFQGIRADGSVLARIRGIDGAFLGGSVAPIHDYGGNLGAPATRFRTTYSQVLKLSGSRFTDLPGCTTESAGSVAFVTDANQPPVQWRQPVLAGGGNSRALVLCDGSGWLAIG